MTPTIVLGELKEYLDIYGADFNRWPADLADSAKKLISSSDEALKLYTDACDFDSVVTGDKAPSGLFEKIVSAVHGKN